MANLRQFLGRGRGADAAVVAIGLLVLAYVALRSVTLSITHDEALTLAWHVPEPWSRIALFRTPGLPDNNHVLFTLLAKLSVLLFGASECVSSPAW